MAFKNPWGKGSDQFDKWFKNRSTADDGSTEKALNNFWDKGENAFQSVLSASFASVGEFDFPARSVSEVISLVLENDKGITLPGQIAFIKKRETSRREIITEVLSLSLTSTQAEKNAVNRMSTRFSTFIANINQPNFDVVSGALGYSEQDVLDEQADIDSISANSSLTMTAAVCQQFLDEVTRFEEERRVHNEEIKEYERLDHEFNNRDVIKLVNAIPHARFRAADVKALVSQESSDLTNKALAGLESKTLGIVVNAKNTICASCIGIAQMQPGAMQDATKWAARKGIIIPDIPDPRTVTQEAIKLAAAYLGYVAQDLLIPGLPDPVPSGIEFKKLVFSAYNAGSTSILKGVKEFVGTSGKEYTWSDVSVTSAVKKGPGQPIPYVNDITKRLGA